MVEVNKITTPANMRWKLVDRATGAENAAIDWRFRVGDQVKIRLVNEMDSDHPMHHPFHVHGAGRFLILTRNGVVEPNLVWKDTVLVRTGETVDILLDITNPGVWMAHCHIAEHHESGMMFSFTVDPASERPRGPGPSRWTSSSSAAGRPAWRWVTSAQQGQRFPILEPAEVGAAWWTRWDSLRLFTPAHYDSLPGRHSRRRRQLPRHDDVANYLPDYARAFELPLELNTPYSRPAGRRRLPGRSADGD